MIKELLKEAKWIEANGQFKLKKDILLGFGSNVRDPNIKETREMQDNQYFIHLVII